MLTEQIRLFAFSGVDIRLHVSWLPFALLLLWLLYQHVFPSLVPELSHGSYRTMAFAGAVAFFLSVLFREMARLLAARQLEVPIEEITLHIFGGIAELPETTTTGKDMLALAASGFFGNLLMAGLLAALLIGLVDVRTPLELIGVGFFLVLLNIALALANFIPSALLAGWRYWSA
jgi:Zn-dependent protease